MNIKYLLSSLVILLSVSFNAFSSSYVKMQVHNLQPFVYSDSANDAKAKAVGQCFYHTTYPWQSYILTGYSGGQATATVFFDSTSCSGRSEPGKYLDYRFYSISCPDGQHFNPDTDQCEDSSPPPFCSRPDTIQQMSDYSQSCSAKGPGYQANIICRDEDEYLDMSCPPPTEQCTPDSPDYPNCCDESNNWCDNPPPESCTIFSPNWPACSGDTDIDPPTGGDLGDPDKPNGGGTGNPDPDKPEPDVEENSDTIKAIESMNKDLNKQLTGINNDLNKNHAENISHLDALKDSIDLNTDTIVDSSNHLKNAIESQTGTLSEIGNTNNKLLSSLNHLLNDGIGELSGDLKGIEGAINSGLDDLESGINGSINAGNCQSFSCEGNAATCYLAKQAWYESCQSKDLSEITEAGAGLLEGIGDYNDQFTDEHGAYKNIYENAEGSVGDLLQAYDESNGVNFDGECPPPKHYDGGLFKFTIDLAPFCEMAYIIRACIMAAAAFGSFMMISKFI
ncbi:TPA: virulence factor TspB C-terminal domain-related protein [Vibrio parahaemolyticus]|uniref:virulence factor TspB C-terminal domain-related protein n=1 Tax=Vibrio parahaemolyticus TaxID=670 RepID=UPI000403100C|nr:virulence factor TspB C-terminal domain-related protein [Vibrio parahaemolyticus]